MCLAVPGKIIEIYEAGGLKMARLDYGGVVREACLAYVPEAQLRRIRTGMAAEVSTDSQPDRRITAKLDYIASAADFTPKTVQTPELRTSQVYDARVAVEMATLQENWLGLQAEFESITGDSAA